MTTRTLIVTVESLGDVRRRSDSALERALSGDVPDEDAPRRLSFETTDQLTSVFSARAIDLLQTIAREGPESMREAARLVDRDIKQVSKNLERLAEYDVVEFVEEGRSKRPLVPFDDIEVRLPLRKPGGEPTEEAGA
jgi:predicted transcriptional regulator